MNTESQLIGRVSATEKNPNTCDEFTFWLKKGIKLSSFDIVKVQLEDSITYGIVEDIFHITDSPSHLSNFVSSDFGDVEANERTRKLSLSYARVSVLTNTKHNYMPIMDGKQVQSATEEDIIRALGLDVINNDGKAIPAGLFNASNGISVPVCFNSDFLIGPEGAHLNMSGISGLATKTSYIMFLLKAIQEKQKDTAIVILNVKGDDLLQIDEPNVKITQSQRNDWEKFGIEASPFKNVKYLYPYTENYNTGKYSNTALGKDSLNKQLENGKAKNFIYTYNQDKDKIDLLFSNIDDPNYTMESILNFISTEREFRDLSWSEFKEKVAENRTPGKGSSNKDITIQSWKKFSRLITNSINNDIFQESLSTDPKRHQTHISKELYNIEANTINVIDIAKLDEQLQCLVFGDAIKTIYDLKHGDYDKEYDRTVDSEPPKKIIIFVDELNKYAASSSPKNSPILNLILEICERGRSEGVILFSAEQFKSAIHDRVKGNCGTHIYGRTNAIEISKADYKFVPKVYSNMMNRLDKGDLIIQHPLFRSLLKIKFPYPAYKQGGGDNGER